MNAEEYLKRGENYFSKSKFDEAIADFSEAIKLEPDNPFSYNKRGSAYMNKKEYDLALSDFNKAIELYPNKVGSFYADRGVTYVYKGDNVSAISDLEIAINIDPQNKDYKDILEEIKNGKAEKDIKYKNEIKNNKSEKNLTFRKIHLIVILILFIIGIIIGIVIGGILVGLFFGLLFSLIGVGIFSFLFSAMEYLIEALIDWWELTVKSFREEGFFEGLKSLFMYFFITFIVALFKLVWAVIKAPFVGIYQLATGIYFK